MCPVPSRACCRCKSVLCPPLRYVVPETSAATSRSVARASCGFCCSRNSAQEQSVCLNVHFVVPEAGVAASRSVWERCRIVRCLQSDLRCQKQHV